MLTHVDLFSGIGGFSLAAGWAGFTTVAFCEQDAYCQAVLKKHWPEVPIVGDIREFKWPLPVVQDSMSCGCVEREDGEQGCAGDERDAGAGNSKRVREQEDIRDFNREEDGLPFQTGSGGKWPMADAEGRQPRQLAAWDWRQGAVRGSQEVTLLTGGFPCQPFSVAGKRRGKEDDRFLWPEMLRVIAEVRPRWVLGENVAGIVRMELDRVLADLEGEGYSTQAFVIPACAVNAPHRRDRVWIVAHSARLGRRGRCDGDAGGGDRALQTARPCAADEREDVAHRNIGGRQVERLKEHHGQQGASRREPDGCGEGRCGEGQDVAHAEEAKLMRYQRTRAGRERLTDDGRGSTQPRLGDGPDGIPAGMARWGDGWEEGIPRVAKGVEERVNKLKALGNAIVPEVAYQVIQAIAEIELTEPAARDISGEGENE